MSPLRLIPPGGGSTSEPPTHLTCDEVAPFVVPFIDGQCDAEEAKEIGDHIHYCPHCSRVAEAAKRDRAHLRRAMEMALPERDVPPSLLGKIAGALEAERVHLASHPQGVAAVSVSPVAADKTSEPAPPTAGVADAAPSLSMPRASPSAVRPPWARVGWWSWAPMVGMAVISVAFAWAVLSPQTGGTSTRALIEDSVRRHARNLPPEVADSDVAVVRRWFMGKLEFGIGDLPLRMGPSVPLSGGMSREGVPRLVGARISHVLDRPAAQFLIDRDGKRCSLLVFERPPRVAPDAAGGGEEGSPAMPRAMGKLTVYASRAKGYNVLFWAQDTLAYTLVCDQPLDRMLDGLWFGEEPGP